MAYLTAERVKYLLGYKDNYKEDPMSPDEQTDEERLEKLPEDGDTPFTPAGPSRDDGADPEDDRQADDARARTDDTRPVTDTDVEVNELYQQGQEEVGSNLGSDVEKYDPEQDQRREP